MLLFVASITTLLYYWSFAFAHLFGVAGVQTLPRVTIIEPFEVNSGCCLSF